MEMGRFSPVTTTMKMIAPSPCKLHTGDFAKDVPAFKAINPFVLKNANEVQNPEVASNVSLILCQLLHLHCRGRDHVLFDGKSFSWLSDPDKDGKKNYLNFKDVVKKEGDKCGCLHVDFPMRKKFLALPCAKKPKKMVRTNKDVELFGRCVPTQKMETFLEHF